MKQIYPTPNRASTFLELIDVPSTYYGQGGKFVRINAGALTLEFVSHDKTLHDALDIDADTLDGIHAAGFVTAPGGADTQVQFNDGGVFGGSSALTFNKTTAEFILKSNKFRVGDATYYDAIGVHIEQSVVPAAGITPIGLYFRSTLKADANNVELDGVFIYPNIDRDGKTDIALVPLRIDSPSIVAGAGSIANLMMVELSVANIATNNYGIYCWGAGAPRNYFSGSIGIGVDAVSGQQDSSGLALGVGKEVRLYNVTGADYERAYVKWDANIFKIGTEVGGAGTVRNLMLVPGAGAYVMFGTHAAIGAEAVTGYITIEDEAGNLRKLAVVS